MSNLQSKIFVFFLALLFVVMTFILLIVYRTTYTHTQAQIAEQLGAGNAVVQNELESRKRYVGSTSRTITKDFNLIEQVVSRDANSIAAAIESYSIRAGATFSVVTDTKGKIIASTLNDMEVGQVLPFGNFSEDESAKAQNIYGILNDHAYQVFIWPLYAPEPNQIACLVMGYVLDDNLTTRLQKLTGLDISFIHPGKVFASSLSENERKLLMNASISSASANSWSTLTLDNIDYVTFTASLPMSNGQAIVVLLQRSLTDALRDYKSLQLQLVATQVLSLILAAIGAFFIASTITRPLRRMTEYVKHIAEGKYSASLPLDSKGEIGILVQEFTHMQHEITEREASILHLAYHDALTNLPNRNEFQRRVQAQVDNAKESSGRAAVFVMDLDNFSDINVTLGYLSGDVLLKKVAEYLLKECREGDHIARLGGDEFAILISDANSIHDVIQSVMHYRKIFNEAFDVENISLTVNATFGVAIYPEHAENAGTLMQRAEVAMYIGKRKKMPYSIYNSTQDHHSILRLALMSELKSAIENNELVLYYQPKLDLASNSIHSVECLVRWVHPVHGFISPNDFIPLAEQTGNIRLLTRWVITTAFIQHKKWRDEHGLSMSMSINVSAVDLLDPGFISYVESQLQEYELPAPCVVLEVTESAVMDDPEKAIAMLSQLHVMGIGLSIDDFGTGYSSMAQLKRLPVHELKIDKSFVLDVINSEDDQIIVRSIIELAHNMQLKVVAEGVESLAVLNLLQELNCDSVQGFYLSKPVPAPMFEKWLSNSSYLIPRLDKSTC